MSNTYELEFEQLDISTGGAGGYGEGSVGTPQSYGLHNSPAGHIARPVLLEAFMYQEEPRRIRLT